MNQPIEIVLGEKSYMFYFNNYAIMELGRLLECDPSVCAKALMEMLKLGNLLDAIVFIVTAGVIGYEKSQGNFKHGVVLKDIALPMSTVNINDFTHVYEAFRTATDTGEWLASLPQETEKKKK